MKHMVARGSVKDSACKMLTMPKISCENLLTFEYGVVQTCVNLLDVQKYCKMNIWFQESAVIELRISIFANSNIVKKGAPRAWCPSRYLLIYHPSIGNTAMRTLQFFEAWCLVRSTHQDFASLRGQVPLICLRPIFFIFVWTRFQIPSLQSLFSSFLFLPDV